ncbi:PH and SEC7 domain-containing protein [Paramyrothecium foliicola]|nr:PH and SEC7 domain-containing protein [Paramyrothecium foliicola]
MSSNNRPRRNSSRRPSTNTPLTLWPKVSSPTPPDRKPPLVPSARPSSQLPARGPDAPIYVKHSGPVDRSQDHSDDEDKDDETDDSATDEAPDHDAMPDRRHNTRGPERDSHDLSLSPRDVTRDSLVNNMLLSLDQMSLGQSFSAFGSGSGPFEDANSRPFDSLRSLASNNAGRQPSHQYSYSSDLDGGDDSSRLSSQTSRGRRSNSSSNFHATFPKLNSVLESSHRVQQPGAGRGTHSRSGKGSSSSASIDAGYAQVMAANGQRRTRGVGRSASFDYSPQQPPPQHPASTPISPFRIELPNGIFASDDYDDAAPTPTIPSGPRRNPSTPSVALPPPPLPPALAESPIVERRRSISRSVKSSSSRKGGHIPYEPAPAMPPLSIDSAPAPHVGYEKSKEAARDASASTATPAAAKEKTGFFWRVFGGGSKNNSNAAAKVNTTPAQPQQPASGAPPSRDTSSSHSHRPTLQKKTSAFFRRRRKSVHEDAPPVPVANVPPPVPTVPVEITPEPRRQETIGQDSPVSSLRNVMNPYLRDSPATNTSTPAGPLNDITNKHNRSAREDRETFKRDFSPDYEPSPTARIRKVDADSAGPRWDDTPTKAPTKRSPAEKRVQDTFLNLDGGSDNDDSSPRRSRTASPTGNPRRDKSPRGPNKQANDERPVDGVVEPKAEKKIEQKAEKRVEQRRSRPELKLPLEGTRDSSPATSTGTDYNTAPSGPPSVRIEISNEPSPKISTTLKHKKSRPFDEPEVVIGEPSEDDRRKARQIFDGNEDFIQKDKAAGWMGEEGTIRQRTLQAYMELYDFTDQSIVKALRQVCGRLVLRAETQQVDRILVAFSKRWCQCNPRHGFKANDVIHTICYSIMLLNTDLHLADIEQKMTRSQFIKNTMTTITHTIAESVPDAFLRPSILPEKHSTGGDRAPSPEPDRKTFRHSFRPPPRENSGFSDNGDEGDALVKSPFNGSKKAWEEQMELVLKGIYTSIRDERLPLFGADPEKLLPSAPSQSSLSVIGLLKRTPSVLSKAPSESQLSMRGRIAESSRNNAARWGSKSRSRVGNGRTGFSSSRTSFEDENSLFSPAMSSATWSRYSLGRTQTSVSQDSFGSAVPRGNYQQSIGFANALSQAIIRDEDAGGLERAASLVSADISAATLLEDDSLELAGPPWMKEGMVIHKHHLDGVDKKAKDRNWAEVFAVIQKGRMSLFSFTQANKSLRQKNRPNNPGKTTVVGGGNWQDNATSMGTFDLRQTLASALPSPGYSRTRPHVWALSLPTGAVHLFQVGTPEIIKEFVITVNYWSSRLSTHPLVGGISNIEYGWSDAIVNNALVAAINETNGPKTERPGSAATGRRSSMHSASLRSFSFDQGPGSFTHSSGRGKLPGDRVHIAEWAPPTQSMRPSHATEPEQLQMLAAYVKSIENDLQTHNQLRSPMLLAFTPRGQNANKAMANWERKSSYLLKEIVKYRTYVDCLQQAEARKQEIHAERTLARRAARGELSDGDMDLSDDEEGDETLRP